MKKVLAVSPLMGVLVLVALLAFFAEITREVTAGQGAVLVLDQWVLEHTPYFHYDVLTGIMTFLTGLGGRRLIWGATAIVTVLLLLRKKYASAVFLVVAVTGGWFLEGFLKDAIQRPRPLLAAGEALVHARGWSYPSAHATLSIVFYGAVAYLGAGQLATEKKKRALWCGALVLAVVIALSRVYLQVHHLSDIVAGLVLGLLWLMVCIATAGCLAKRWSVKKVGHA